MWYRLQGYDISFVLLVIEYQPSLTDAVFHGAGNFDVVFVV